MTVSEKPSMNEVPLLAPIPETRSRTPNTTARTGRIRRRRRRFGRAGSGRLRTAAVMFKTLTRHADTVTTTSVRRTPSAYASTMLPSVTLYMMSMPKRVNAAAST